MIPEKYQEVEDQMKSRLYTVDYDAELFEPSIAFTNNLRESVLGEISHIYINNKDELLAKYLFMHECGHILFGHCHNMELREKSFLEPKIHASFMKVQRLFANDYDRYYECFRQFIFNTVMDFEVNSRMFSSEEWHFMCERVQQLTNDINAQGCWPEDYGFEPGKNWNEYLNLILMNIEDFIYKFKMVQAIRAAQKRSLKSDFNGVLSEYEYERIKRECKKMSLSKKDLDSIKKISENHFNGFNIPTGGMDDQSGYGGGLQTRIMFTYYQDMPDLLNKVKKLLCVKRPAVNLRNQMYNTNRCKYATSIIIPKNVRYERTNLPDLYLILDVSGSIDSKMVHDFVNTFQSVKNQFKHTKLIFWSTWLEGEYTLDDNIPDLYGGGTDIAKGIKYVREKYKFNNRDVLFVISDFCDNMRAWEIELKKIKCKRYAIDWSPYSDNSNPGFEKILKNEQTAKCKS